MEILQASAAALPPIPIPMPMPIPLMLELVTLELDGMNIVVDVLEVMDGVMFGINMLIADVGVDISARMRVEYGNLPRTRRLTE